VSEGGQNADTGYVHTVSVVVPVYQGERTLPTLVKEVAPLTSVVTTQSGHSMRVAEVILAYDHGPDQSAETIRSLADEFAFVRPVWLSRNFGQHAATLAGMASSGSDWIVTMDEDGQHDPADIARFLDIALAEQVRVVYGDPTNAAPHGGVRNAASRGTKWIFSRLLSPGEVPSFQSFRLVLGEIGRSVAAYAGSGVFLDVALGWVNGRTAACPIRLRHDNGRPSGYSMRRLLSHFWRMVITSGTRALRLVSALGAGFAVIGIVLAAVLVVLRLTGDVQVAGWTSVMVVVLLGTGVVLFALGMIAEYLGVAVNMAMGKPPYLIVGDPADGPLGARLPRMPE
jgi:undecaprenyl-phosphate 4-deoxy-4-formamido-L-arabinose transferase